MALSVVIGLVLFVSDVKAKPWLTGASVSYGAILAVWFLLWVNTRPPAWAPIVSALLAVAGFGLAYFWWLDKRNK
jgi:hypothetical protein